MKKIFAVNKAFRRGPVGLIDLFFDPGLMKGSERKAVDGEGVAFLGFDDVFQS